MSVMQTRPVHRWQSMGVRLALAVLHSPLRFLLEPGIAELTYTGPRTGRTIRLPVMYAKAGHQVAVLAGAGHRKTWWRNFRHPQPVQVTIGAQTWDGTAIVTGPGTPEFHATLELYRQRFPRTHYRPGDQLVAITLES